MNDFIPLRISRKCTIELPAGPEVVFPLFSPVEERKWVEGWDPVLVYPASGEVQNGSVFLTHTAASENPAVWVTAEFEPEKFKVRYLRMLVNDHVADIRIQCERGKNGSTLADIRYIFTGLSESGNASIAVFTEEHYAHWINGWKDSIERFLLSKMNLP